MALFILSYSTISLNCKGIVRHQAFAQGLSLLEARCCVAWLCEETIEFAKAHPEDRWLSLMASMLLLGFAQWSYLVTAVATSPAHVYSLINDSLQGEGEEKREGRWGAVSIVTTAQDPQWRSLEKPRTWRGRGGGGMSPSAPGKPQQKIKNQDLYKNHIHLASAWGIGAGGVATPFFNFYMFNMFS